MQVGEGVEGSSWLDEGVADSSGWSWKSCSSGGTELWYSCGPVEQEQWIALSAARPGLCHGWT